MSVRKLTKSLLTAIAMFGGMTLVSAQEKVPVADPLAFDPDFHWFEPVYDMDLADMKPSKRAGTGWFASYDRIALYASRPEIDDPNRSETLLDRGWGHRYEIGYMLPDKDTGWMFNWTTFELGQFQTTRQQRLNLRNTDDQNFFQGPLVGATNFWPFPDGNNVGFLDRFYDIQDCGNVMQFDSYELNKMWRLEPYHYGGILEPLVGVRWMRLDDTNAFQSYQSTIDAIPLVLPSGNDGERLTTNANVTENEMLGGQLGFRYRKYRERFTFMADFRAFFGGNYQSSRAQTTTETTEYAGTAENDAVLRNTSTATDPIYTRNEEFFVGFDVRGQVGYQLTKLIKVRAGFQVLDIGRGVWRGGPPISSGRNVLEGGDNDQDVFLAGGTFGLDLNF